MTTATTPLNDIPHSLSIVSTPGGRLKALLSEDGLSGVDIVDQLHAYDPKNYSLNYRGNLSKMLNSKLDIPLALLHSLEEIRGYNRLYIQTGKGQPRLSGVKSAHLDIPLLTTSAMQEPDMLLHPDRWTARHRLYGQSALSHKDQYVIEVPDDAMQPQLNPGARLRVAMVGREEYTSVSGVVVVCCAIRDTFRLLVRRINEVGPPNGFISLYPDRPTAVKYVVPVETIYWLAKVERIVDSSVL